MDSNRLLINWVLYLEGENQKEFCRKTGISEATISRIKKNVTVASKATTKRLREVYGITPQEYDRGPQDYEKMRREKESAAMQPVKPLLDPERASPVYALSQIQESLSRSPSLGVSFNRQFESRPKDFAYVYVDREGETIPFGQLVCLNIVDAPNPGDLVLIWNGEMATFVKWKQRSKANDFSKFLGWLTIKL